MIAEREFDIVNRLGLHARAAAQLVRLANRYASEIRVQKDGVEVNGKSIMGVLMLAAPKDSRIAVRATGEDAEAALPPSGN
jgi:phosphocarrier protein